MTTEEFKEQLMQRVIQSASRTGARLVEELARVVGVQAPYRIAPSGRYIATVPATTGAPPRRLSGKGQSSLTYFVERGPGDDTITLWVGTDLVYMAAHERKGNHVWLYKTLFKKEQQIKGSLEKEMAK